MGFGTLCSYVAVRLFAKGDIAYWMHDVSLFQQNRVSFTGPYTFFCSICSPDESYFYALHTKLRVERSYILWIGKIILWKVDVRICLLLQQDLSRE